MLKTIKIIICIVFLLVTQVTFVHAKQTTSAVQDFITPKLNIEIPDIKFTKAKLNKEDELIVNYLADYLSATYKILLTFGSVIAITFIIIGGLQYSLGATSQEQASKAKKRIKNATSGLILLTSTYLILYTINPNLVNFDSLTLDTMHAHDLPIYVREKTKAEQKIKTPPCKGKTVASKNWGLGKVDNTLDDLACGQRDVSKIKFFVIHEGGKNNKTIKILERRGLSTHYVIERDGTIIQSAGIEKRARHAGAINHWSIGIDLAMPVSDKTFFKGKGSRKGCSQSGKCALNDACSAECWYTDAQYRSVKKILSLVIPITDIKLDDEHIVGHCQIGGHGDPRNFQWDKLGLDQSKHRVNPIAGRCVKVDWAKMVK